jgi:hypothetical protein
MSHPQHIGLIVTGENTLKDFKIFARTLELVHPDAVLYIATDSLSAPALRAFKTRLTLHLRISLDAYTGLDRAAMERRSGSAYATLWTDFMYEKANILEWALLEAKGSGAWFMDADIAHCASLPVVPDWATVGLSPHYIRDSDASRFGKYNGGFLWMRDASLLAVWRAAGHIARFYEQSALEEVAASAAGGLYEFPPSVNFGWWRMFQAQEAPTQVQARFSIFRVGASGIGVRYDGAPLQSIHTHFYEHVGITGAFNNWIKTYVERIARVHAPAAQWLRAVAAT